MLNPHIFRAYDVRGRVGPDLNGQVFEQVGRAYATLIRRRGGRRIAVGQDNRTSSRDLAAGFIAGVRAAGGDVVDIGLVGEVAAINPMVIETLDRGDMIPVIAPVGAGDEGETYNINADLVAGKIAEALRAEKLILLTDVDGIHDAAGSIIQTLADEHARRLIADGTIGEGMIPKVECCLEALKNGVKQAHIVDGRVRHAVLLEIFTREGVGTEVVRGGRPTRVREPRRVGDRAR